MRVLVVNAGSSSVKLQVLDEDDSLLGDRTIDGWDGDAAPIGAFVDELPDVHAVGHRVVHGGPDLVSPTVLDDDVLHRIESLTPLAPLHQPRAVTGIEAVTEHLPDVPQVACFDTSYHATLERSASTYALPADWSRRWGLRRFGFHGLSHQYAARRAGQILGTAELRVVTCHLGAGASLCASRGGRSVDTTMGFTPLEGLVMATRAGSVDPGLLLWLQTNAGVSAEELADVLEHRSGVAGLTGGSGDMKQLLADRDAGDDAAVLAFDLYVHTLAKEIAAMVTALGGLDALVFTGGVGEHAGPVREAAVDRLAFLGIGPLPSPVERADEPEDRVLSSTGRAAVMVVRAREDLEVARGTREALAGR